MRTKYFLYRTNIFAQVENYCEYSSEWMDNFNDARVDEIIDLNSAEKSFMKVNIQYFRYAIKYFLFILIIFLS